MDEHVEKSIAGGTWLFLANLTTSITGFLFWVILTRIAGVDSVGAASAIISAAGISATLTAAGLNIAVIREAAAHRGEAVKAATLLSLIAGLAAALLSIPLTRGLGEQGLAAPAALLALATTLATALTFSLVGLERFKEYFNTILAASTAKLATGIALGILGYKTLAPLIGYLAYPVAAVLASLATMAPIITRAGKPSPRHLRSLAKLAYSNYPYVFSNQLLTMLGVYIFAYTTGETASTGALYISLMITLAITAIPASILNAALPIATRRGKDPFTDTLRIGLALATPLIAAATAAPHTILSLINPQLASHTETLQLLLLTITPLATLTAAINKLNKQRDTRQITLIGATRLALLLALLTPLTKQYYTTGAAAAYLITNTATLPLSLKHLPQATTATLTLWTLQTLPALATHHTLLNEPILATIAATLTIPAIHLTKTTTITEIKNTIKTIKKTIKI